MHGYPVVVHFEAGPGHQDESAATHICLDLQCGPGDHRVREVEGAAPPNEGSGGPSGERKRGKDGRETTGAYEEAALSSS